MSLPVDVRAKFGHSFSEFLAASQDTDFLDRLGVKPTEQPASVPPVSDVADKPVKEVVSE